MDKAANSALSKCRNLSDLEKSEVGLLQSRIEEQSHLIMILKSRADDEYHRRKSFEKIVDEMQFNSTDNEERFASESRKVSMLEEKFDILGMSCCKLNEHGTLIQERYIENKLMKQMFRLFESFRVFFHKLSKTEYFRNFEQLRQNCIEKKTVLFRD